MVTVITLFADFAYPAPPNTAMDSADCPDVRLSDTPQRRGVMQSILSAGAVFQVPDLSNSPTQIDKKTGDYPGLCHFSAQNSSLRHAPRVIFMGDSITENWLEGDPSIFSEDIINRGISAQTTGQMLGRFYADVVALQPRVVHLMAGTNDIAGNTGPISEQTFKNNMMAMIAIARHHHIRVIVASIPPADHFWWAPTWTPAVKISTLNAWLRQYCRKTHISFVDYYSVLVGKNGAIDPRYSNDGVHPNFDGYRAMRPGALSAIKKN